MSTVVAVPAPAKVNLFLRVLERRPDGYHEIDTLFQAISLADEVHVELGGSGIRLEVDGPDLGPVVDNLAFRAAESLADAAGWTGGVRIGLAKRIPAGAGLGGGSSDAAAVLRALSTALDFGDRKRLLRIAAELGSDVPFFLGGSALARGGGRGEILDSLDALPAAELVVVSPPVHVSTAVAYRTLSERREPGVRRSPVRPLDWAPDSWEEVTSVAWNDFQPLVCGTHPEVGRALEALETVGAGTALMSGSGSSVFGIFGGREEAEDAADRLRSTLGWPCVAARTLDDLPEVAVG